MHRLHILVYIVFSMLLPASAKAAYKPHRDVIAGPISGEVLNVLDGDTLEVRLHVWIGSDVTTHVRIDGIDAPELRGKCAQERAMADRARAELARLVSGGRVVLRDVRLEKYAGRVLARVAATDGTDIARHMIDAKFARAYGGEKRAGWCPSP